MAVKKLEEVDLANMAVKYGTEDVKLHFSPDNKVEYSIVLNTGAHGYFMGYRFAEHFYREPNFFRKFLPEPVMSEEKLWDQSIDAAKTYVRARGYDKLCSDEYALVYAAVRRGFIAGFNHRTAKEVTG